MIRPIRSLALLVQGALVFAGPVVAQDLPGEVRVTSDALELQIGGRLHTQLNHTSIDGEPGSQLLIRRARVELSMRLGDRVSGALQPEFGNDQVGLRDAYVQFEVTPDLALRAGKFYRPFGLLEQTSSKRILPVERGLRIRGLNAFDEYAIVSGLDYSNRDVGLQILSETDAGIEIAAGIFRGPLHGEVGPNASYQYVANMRGPVGDDLRVGAGWSARDFASVVGLDVELRKGHAFEVDLEYGTFAPGLHVLAEVALGDVSPFTGSDFHGAHVWLAFRTEPRTGSEIMLEPLLRLSYADVGLSDAPATQQGGLLATPGFAVYFGALNRIAVNYDLWWAKADAIDANSFKIMFQLGF